jgi:hypothetical protein
MVSNYGHGVCIHSFAYFAMICSSDDRFIFFVFLRLSDGFMCSVTNINQWLQDFTFKLYTVVHTVLVFLLLTATNWSYKQANTHTNAHTHTNTIYETLATILSHECAVRFFIKCIVNFRFIAKVIFNTS